MSTNAVNSDGSKYGKLDENTKKGYSPGYVAEKVLKAIAENEIDLVLADVKSKAAVFAKPFLPNLLAMIISKRK